MTHVPPLASLIAPVDARMPASICSGRSAITRTGPAEMLATRATFDSRREPATSAPPLTGVCKNEIIATNRPATSGFRPTPE